MKAIKLSDYILVVLFGCCLIIWLVLSLPIDDSLAYGIVSETIGSGILGVVVTVTLYQYQKQNEYDEKLSKIRVNFYEKIVFELKKIIKNDKELWGIFDDEKFYFSSSYINLFFNITERSLTTLIEYKKHFPLDIFAVDMINFHNSIEDAYIAVKKMDEILRAKVRDKHYELGISQYNDQEVFQYLRAKLFTPIEEDILFKYLDWKNKNLVADELYGIVSDEWSDVIDKIKIARKQVLTLENEIVNKINKYEI